MRSENQSNADEDGGSSICKMKDFCSSPLLVTYTFAAVSDGSMANSLTIVATAAVSSTIITTTKGVHRCYCGFSYRFAQSSVYPSTYQSSAFEAKSKTLVIRAVTRRHFQFPLCPAEGRTRESSGATTKTAANDRERPGLSQPKGTKKENKISQSCKL